jgi:phenylacetate-CoA ligase
MKSILSRIMYRVVSPCVRLLHASGICAAPLLLPGLESPRWVMGRLGAWVRYQSALRRVPAYHDFLEKKRSMAALAPSSWSTGSALAASFENLPFTDKENYVKVFSLDSRCVGGRMPKRGVIIDESSGSSGTPTNWIRGNKERASNRRAVKLGLARALGKEPPFVINAFALGPWATGINITLALSSSVRMKALGPDLAKIENTLLHFGPDFHYVIMGYPPFLKNLADSPRIDWKRYHISMIFGGEGMGESMRRYLQAKGIGKVYGSYGASDLDINLAAETDFTIALRRLLEANPALSKNLLRHPGALPMIFQFNPADFFIETTSEGELLVTVCRPGCLTPKVRYNIHDLGHVVRFPELKRILALEKIRPSDLDPAALDLPILFHYGRSDLSAAYFGCKIPPADIQETLFRMPELARTVDAFQLRTFDDEGGDKRLALALETKEGSLMEGAGHWGTLLFDTLASINQDFRESRRMVPMGKEPFLEFHAPGTGPFIGSDIRIKRNYVQK